MATDRRISPLPADPARGDRAGRGPGRLLRAQIGVHEPVLDRVPSERVAYSRYGGIVLATAVLGGIAVCLALNSLLGSASPWALLAAGTVWAVFVFLVDSWLVSSTHGRITGRRRLALLPRFLLSLLLGLAMAEPLLFQVFAPEMNKHLAGEREQAVQAYYRDLLRCNPAYGTSTENLPGCAHAQLGLQGSPAALRTQIGSVKDQLAKLTAHIDAVDKRQAKLDTTSNELCSRKNYIRVGGGLDVTQQCRIARQEADGYRHGNDVDADRARATALRNRIDTLTTRMKSATDEYRVKVLDAARTKRAAKDRELRSTGLLDRADALWAVMTSAFYPCFLGIVLHLLLLVLDSLPVLVKLMGGVSRYDRLLHRHLESAERRYEAELRAEEDRHRERLEKELAVLRAEGAQVREAASHELAKARARRESERRALIDELAERLLRRDAEKDLTATAPDLAGDDLAPWGAGR
ncbi:MULTISPECIES: DUF4407 domain-containing protein [unclassified Streptomyces]|uniref:DUF4407 domain-containing protein n=1 Tax=unclassified Streptomyces TaxID=2593676 RepID=UPI0040413CEB